MLTLPPTIVLASGNAGKLRELKALLPPRIELLPQSVFDLAPAAETGDSFAANAVLKAQHAAAATGHAALADDSGICVDALDGRPGVHSARYSGGDDRANVNKLLLELDGVAEPDRGAAFVCCLCFLQAADAEAEIFRGEWRGRILDAPRGERGFGYDPVFFDPVLGRCAAEMTLEEKAARSHRGQALRAFRAAIGA